MSSTPDKVLTLREALSHPLRREIISRLIEKPGISVRQLARELGISTGVLTGHLVILERVGLVREVRLSRRIQLFVTEEMLARKAVEAGGATGGGLSAHAGPHVEASQQ